MGRKRWIIRQLNKDEASMIAEKFSLEPFSALLLSQRGFKNDDEIKAFLGRERTLIDPFTLPDMEKAVDRINQAIFDDEIICIFGDYDCDGVTATALLYSYLEMQGANVTYLLPDRSEDGYGLSRGVVDRIKAIGTNLVVTVDNGISAIEEAKYIKELGMELVVTDHHLPGDELPDCVAVVDPHRTDSNCEFSDYAGVGVAFKLCCALEGDSASVLEDFVDFVALGTIADMVPLKGENRYLVKLGLNLINSAPRIGIESLIEVTGLKDKQITSSNISFGLGPRINAAGRMSSAEQALELLICEEPLAADEIASELHGINADRHSEEEKIVSECINLIIGHPKFAHNPVLVVYGDNWHEGVLGIVASKLLDKYSRPVIVLSNKDGVSKGSARSIEGFSIFEALSACSEHLVMFGGHAQAAGLTINTKDIPAFIESINAYAYTQPVFYPSIYVDCKLNPDSISTEILDALKVLEPFGSENPQPNFAILNLVVDGITELGDRKQHYRIHAHKEGRDKQLTLMKFNASPASFPYKQGDKFDALVTLDKNVWNGQVRVSVIIKDTRPCNTDDDEMVKSEKIYDKIETRTNLSADEASYATPDRSLFARIYTFLKRNPNVSMNAYEYIAYKTIENSDENLCKVKVAILAMIELGLIVVKSDGIITVPSVSQKFDLNSAPVMEFLREVNPNA